MSSTQAPSPKTQVVAKPIAQQATAILITMGAVVLSVLALFAVYFDQGQLLSPSMGQIATAANYLHEFAHDGRHLLGAPCH